MSLAMFQDTRSIYKNQLYFYTLAMNNLKTQLRNNSKNNKILRNKFNKKNRKYPTLKNNKTFSKKIKDNINKKKDVPYSFIPCS